MNLVAGAEVAEYDIRQVTVRSDWLPESALNTSYQNAAGIS